MTTPVAVSEVKCCEYCGAPLPEYPGVGRPKRFCNRRHAKLQWEKDHPRVRRVDLEAVRRVNETLQTST